MIENQAFEVYEIVYCNRSGRHTVSGYFSESAAVYDAERLRVAGAEVICVRDVG